MLVVDVVDFVFECVCEFKVVFLRKLLLFVEVGWLSNGCMCGSVEVIFVDQVIYLWCLINVFNGEGYSYFVIEVFDQFWKVSVEGLVGVYWGVYNVDCKVKFNFIGLVVLIFKWCVLVIVLVVFVVFVFILLLIDSFLLCQCGRIFFVVVLFVCVLVLVWIVYDYSQQYSIWFSLIVGVLLGVGVLGVVIVLFIEVYELVEVVWMCKWCWLFLLIIVVQVYWFKVLIYVFCYNELLELLKQIFDVFVCFDYLDYEVLVIDNNICDLIVWQLVEVYCVCLGECFCFFYVVLLEGFKVGVLNFVLGYVVVDVEVVVVIDVDYCVDFDWFRYMVLYFGDLWIVVVQLLQDYCDQYESVFKWFCYVEYKGFFYIGMVICNDCDVIIEYGIMIMIWCSVLDELRWLEWCIIEDVELGLWVFEKGLLVVYFECSYGKGVMFDIFIDFKKQCFCWVYGVIQIMKWYIDVLLCGCSFDGSCLICGQCYYFVVGWLLWIVDGLNIFFIFGVLFWLVVMIIVFKCVDLLLLIFVILLLVLFVFKVGKIFFFYWCIVGVDLCDLFFVVFVGLLFLYIIVKVVLYGFVICGILFFCMLKMCFSYGLLVVLVEVCEEVFVMFLLWGVVVGIVVVQGVLSCDLLIWVVMFLV